MNYRAQIERYELLQHRYCLKRSRFRMNMSIFKRLPAGRSAAARDYTVEHILSAGLISKRLYDQPVSRGAARDNN